MKPPRSVASSSRSVVGPRPAAAMALARPYAVPRPSPRIDLHLDANEGMPAHPSILDAVRTVDPEILRRYPDKSRLERIIASRFDISQKQVLVTNGADESLDRCFRAYLEPGRAMLVPMPTFEMVMKGARLAGCRIVEIDWFDQPDPTDAILDCIDDATGAITIVSPNNPTGLTMSETSLRRIAKRAPNALLIVDAAYAEFTDLDLTNTALSLPNAVVVRTFSKAYGMAGMRCGYVMGSVRVIDVLRAAGGPYPVSNVTLIAAEAAMNADPLPRTRYIEQVGRERKNLIERMRKRGVRTWPSEGNFVLLQTPDAARVYEGLARYGIAVRRFSSESDLGQCLRVTCPGNQAQFKRLLSALDGVMQTKEKMR